MGTKIDFFLILMVALIGFSCAVVVEVNLWTTLSIVLFVEICYILILYKDILFGGKK